MGSENRADHAWDFLSSWLVLMADVQGAHFAQNVQTMDFTESQPQVGPQMDRTVHPFAVCRLGVLWRVILGVQAPFVVVALFAAPSLNVALQKWAELLVWVLPPTWVWLVGVCLVAAPLSRASVGVQRAVCASWGAGVAAISYALLHGLAQPWGGPDRGWLQWLAPLLTGAGLGASVCMWLQSRVDRAVPMAAQARLDELQARIRPHFLFNTLNTAIALVQIDPQKAERVLEDLAELFRQAMAAPHASSNLAEEVALAQRYLAIEALRFGDRMTVSWSVDPLCDPVVVPALVLQPLVENAVRHGIERSLEPGSIDITVRRHAGAVEVLIRNPWPTPGPAQERSAGQGMALNNVRERLRLMYDLEASLTLERTNDGHALVTLKVPEETRL